MVERLRRGAILWRWMVALLLGGFVYFGLTWALGRWSPETALAVLVRPEGMAALALVTAAIEWALLPKVLGPAWMVWSPIGAAVAGLLRTQIDPAGDANLLFLALPAFAAAMFQSLALLRHTPHALWVWPVARVTAGFVTAFLVAQLGNRDPEAFRFFWIANALITAFITGNALAWIVTDARRSGRR